MKRALISGITGQDGSYLAELLLKKKYKVYGIIRKSSSFNTSRIEHLFKNNNFILNYGDLVDTSSLSFLVNKINPDEIYNLGAQSHVKVSFEIPDYTAQVDALGTLRFLDIISKQKKFIKFYQASTSELFGNIRIYPQNEKTSFQPCSPYAIAKLYSYWMIKNYRDAYGVFACNGILFNHESPRRGGTFVTQKIISEAIKIKKGLSNCLVLGNLNAIRDWGYAKEYVEAMWLMLQQKKPDDFVIATGKGTSVRDFVKKTFNFLGIEIKWTGKGLFEQGIDKKTNKVIIKVNKKYYRPTDVNKLIGDPRKAKKILGWKAKKSVDDLIKLMILEEEKKYNK